MRVIIQRVAHASVKVDGEYIGKIDQGFMLLVGITQTDTIDIVKKIAKKCAELRVFEDENGQDYLKKFVHLGSESNAFTSFTKTSYLFSCEGKDSFNITVYTLCGL